MKQLLMSPLIAVLCITDLLMETDDFLQLCFTNLAWRKNASLLLYSAFLQLLCDWPLIYFLLQPQCSVICHDRISYMAQNATCWESALDGFQLWWCIMLQQEMKLKSSSKMSHSPFSNTPCPAAARLELLWVENVCVSFLWKDLRMISEPALIFGAWITCCAGRWSCYWCQT